VALATASANTRHKDWQEKQGILIMIDIDLFPSMDMTLVS